MTTKKHSFELSGQRFDTKLFIASVILFIVSLTVLFVSNMVVADQTRVPYAGISPNTAVTTGVSTLKVTEVLRKQGAKPFIAPAGYEYLVLTLSVKNNGETPIDVLPTADTYVKTADGNVSYLTPYTLKNPFHTGKILPGESTAGELSYLVPVGATYKFYVESDWTSTAVPFMLKSNNTETK